MKKKVLIIIIIFLLLCFLGMGGYLYYESKKVQPEPNNEGETEVSIRELDENDKAAKEYLEHAHDPSYFPGGMMGVGE